MIYDNPIQRRQNIIVVTCNLDIVYSGCVAERVMTACSLDIVIGAYLYTLPVTAEVEWLHTVYSDHVNESYSVYLDNVILNKTLNQLIVRVIYI